MCIDRKQSTYKASQIPMSTSEYAKQDIQLPTRLVNLKNTFTFIQLMYEKISTVTYVTVDIFSVVPFVHEGSLFFILVLFIPIVMINIFLKFSVRSEKAKKK